MREKKVCGRQKRRRQGKGERDRRKEKDSQKIITELIVLIVLICTNHDVTYGNAHTTIQRKRKWRDCESMDRCNYGVLTETVSKF